MDSRRILVIAGSDSSGGAGLEADQKVIAAHGCYAMTATTALTAQNTLGVYGIHPVPPEFLKQQLDACFDDIGVDVVKTGMLASAPTIRLVTDMLKARAITYTVVDPVMVATTGASLLPPDALIELRRLAGLAYVLTPNIPELRLLLECDGETIETVEDLERLARRACLELGATWVLAKGGHLPFRDDGTAAKTPAERKIVVNVLAGPNGQLTRIQSPYQDSRNTHGTGCSLASAIAANIAKGIDVTAAVKAAYYVLEHPDVAGPWQRFVDHPFVKALGDGSLPLDSFRGYLIQDYLYLVHFARAGALSGYKSRKMKDIASAAAMVQDLDREMQLHLQFCAEFGITQSEVEATEENTACTAYSRYVLDIGQAEDWFALQVALTPCVIGYGAAARAIHQEHAPTRADSHPYWKWVENYTNEDYMVVARRTMDQIEQHAILQSESRIEDLVRIFVHAVKMEIAFWEMYPCK